MHLLSESNVWTTISEFVDSSGNISMAKGESCISVELSEIVNKSWIQMGESKLENIYSIEKKSPTLYEFESNNPALGLQKGTFNIAHNIIFSRFQIENSGMDGFEVIVCEEKICRANGALYNNGELVNRNF